MRPSFLPTLVLCLLCSTLPKLHGEEPAKKIKVFILAGQSNMEGKGDGGQLAPEEKAALEKAQKHVRFAYNHQPIRPLDVTPAKEGLKQKFGIDSSFGPELFFGLRVAEAWPTDEILLIKRAVGGTSLYGVWNPDWTKEKATAMHEEKLAPLYADFIGYVHEVLAAYKPDQYEICGMLWVQGETDSDDKTRTPLAGETYGQNLQNLISRVRKDTGKPELPFLFVGVGHKKVVEGMTTTASTMKNVSLIPRSDDQASPNFFPQYAVGHYNYEGMKRIGNLLADAYFKSYVAVAPGSSKP